jgi:ABC-type antimicrobial peptide transport system permease subunit
VVKNYFKTTFRSLLKNKTYSFLNIFGLAVGIACAAFIFLWVEDELTFNHNFAKRDYLYHVMQNEKNDAGISTNGSTPGPLAAALKADIPGIVNSGRLSWAMDELAVIDDKSIKENGMYADPSVLSMYALPFIYGNASAALNNPNDIVISESMSKKFFGNSNPVGKTIKMNAKAAYSVDGLYKVTGVFKDLPSNCYYHFQWLSPYTTWEDANDWLKPWNNNLTETIVELSPTANPASINKKLKNYLSTKSDGNTNQCFLFNMNDWHLRGNFVNGVQDGGNIKYVKLFSTIAFIILLIACINFMNLATARSEQRAKEVGVLKVMGAGKKGLIGKFISESLLMSFISLLLAVGLLYLLMPYYNELVEKQLSVNLFNPVHLGCLLGIGLLTGLIAGSYPAFYLSSFNPVKVLKGIKVKTSVGTMFIRKGLVITQFTASVILIISTIIVYKQVQHIKNRNLGYNKDNLIYMDLQGNMKDHFNEIKHSLIATGYVENAATSLHDALHVYSYGDGFNWQGKNPNAKLPIHSNVVSDEYLSTMHMKLVDGRDFYQGNIDSTNVIINESMAKLMGKEGKIGSIITSGNYKLTVVGIIKDFIYNDVYGSGSPLIFFNGNYSATVMAVRFKPNVNLSQALQKTEAVMKSENPGFPFEYRFADKDFDSMFSSETLIGKLAGVFALLAIFISCLGLFGLAAYTAERRTKEIGIRKVLGASVTRLTGLLAKEFLQLVALSCLIAFPVAWWFMHDWLQDYAYRTTMQWWVFVSAGIAALFIALITVSFQAIKAAIANPVKSLRTE